MMQGKAGKACAGVITAALTFPLLSVHEPPANLSHGHDGLHALTMPARSGVVRLDCVRPPAEQGHPNDCGQCAVAIVLGIEGKPLSIGKVCERMNPAGIYTPPGQIVEFLTARGIPAAPRNGGSLEQLAAAVDARRPVITLVSSDGTPHWVTVVGYEWKLGLTGHRTVTGIEIMDYVFAAGKPEGRRMLTSAEFTSIWERPYAGNRLLESIMSHSKFAIEIAPVHAVPAQEGSVGDSVAEGLNRLLNRAARNSR